ncbi:MAG: secondary thiamine-phosphate synthase enzyme YjbQ [Spirochaetota bacterium]
MHETQEFQVSTQSRTELLPITTLVEQAARRSGIREGLCTVYVPHTTAGVTINEQADPDVAADILAYLDRLVPKDPRFLHREGNSDAHIKALITGSSVRIPIRAGRLTLGTWQGIYFAEFDGPRQRSFSVSCLGDN